MRFWFMSCKCTLAKTASHTVSRLSEWFCNKLKRNKTDTALHKLIKNQWFATLRLLLMFSQNHLSPTHQNINFVNLPTFSLWVHKHTSIWFWLFSSLFLTHQTHTNSHDSKNKYTTNRKFLSPFYIICNYLCCCISSGTLSLSTFTGECKEWCEQLHWDTHRHIHSTAHSWAKPTVAAMHFQIIYLWIYLPNGGRMKDPFSDAMQCIHIFEVH